MRSNLPRVASHKGLPRKVASHKGLPRKVASHKGLRAKGCFAQR